MIYYLSFLPFRNSDIFSFISINRDKTKTRKNRPSRPMAIDICCPIGGKNPPEKRIPIADIVIKNQNTLKNILLSIFNVKPRTGKAGSTRLWITYTRTSIIGQEA